MSVKSIKKETIRVLLACARPLATKAIILDITLHSDKKPNIDPSLALLFQLICDKLKIKRLLPLPQITGCY